MSGVEVLVLHGSPGAGKTTLARAVAARLRNAEQAHAAIDMDELGIVYPDQGRSFALDNLAAIWPRYAAVPGLKVLIPSVIADAGERDRLRNAVRGARFVVCELTAPESVLRERVTARESGEFWQQRLRDFVDLYHRRTDLVGIRDFEVSTYGCSVSEAAAAVLRGVGWE